MDLNPKFVKSVHSYLKQCAESLTNIEKSLAGQDPLGEGGQFFTTGKNRVLAPANNKDWKQMEFPFTARGLIIRYYDDLEVAFANPNSSSAAIVLEGSGSYEIGGQPPLNATQIWYRTAETAEGNQSQFRVEAL